MVLKEIKIKWGKLDKYTRLTIIVIFIGIVLRFFLASISHVTGDACWHVNAAKFIANNYKIPVFEPIGRTHFWAPPLFHIITAVFYKFFYIFGKGSAEFSVKLVSPVFGSLMLVYTFLIAKKIFNAKIAFYAVFFLTFLPNHIYHSSIPYIGPMVSLLILASIYYLINDKVIISAILAGLAMLTKFQGIFLYPILIFIIYIKFWKYRRVFIKKFLLITVVSGLIGSLHYLRGLFLFGSPFGGTVGFTSFNILDLVNLKLYLKLYLSFFGVPSGHLSNLFLITHPVLKLLLLGWLFATIFFFLPLIIGFFSFIRKKRKENVFILVWLVSYLLFLFFMMTSSKSYIFSRYLMPIFPVFSIFWALGISYVLLKLKKKKKIFFIVLLVSVVGFVSAEFIKSNMVKGMWGFYEDDFEWVRSNIPKDGVILVSHDNCFTYNFNRYTITYYQGYNISSIDDLEKYDVSYVWVNQEFDVTSAFEKGRSPYPDEFYNDIQKFDVLYYNNNTGTYIYHVKMD